MRQEPLSNQVQLDKNEKHWINLEKEYREMGINIIWYNYDKLYTHPITQIKKINWQNF